MLHICEKQMLHSGTKWLATAKWNEDGSCFIRLRPCGLRRDKSEKAVLWSAPAVHEARLRRMKRFCRATKQSLFRLHVFLPLKKGKKNGGAFIIKSELILRFVNTWLSTIRRWHINYKCSFIVFQNFILRVYGDTPIDLIEQEKAVPGFLSYRRVQKFIYPQNGTP